MNRHARPTSPSTVTTEEVRTKATYYGHIYYGHKSHDKTQSKPLGRLQLRAQSVRDHGARAQPPLAGPA